MHAIIALAMELPSLTLEKTESSYFRIPMELIWSALFITVLSLVITVYFLIRSIKKTNELGKGAKVRTIFPNVIMMMGMALMALQWVINYFVLIVTNRAYCYGCYFSEFYMYSLGLSIFLVGWLIHVQHYLVKPQGIIRHRVLNWYLQLAILTLLVIVVFAYFLFPHIRPQIISISSALTTFVIFSFILIILVIARKDLKNTPHSIAVRRLRLKALIFQALMFFVNIIAGLGYVMLLNMESYYLLDVYGVIVLPVFSNRGLSFVLIFNLLIYWTVYPHEAFIIQEGFHATELSFFVDDARKIIHCSREIKLLSVGSAISQSTSFTYMRTGSNISSESSGSKKKIYLWISDVLVPWVIHWNDLASRHVTETFPEGMEVFFLPLMVGTSSRVIDERLVSKNLLENNNMIPMTEFSTFLSATAWQTELKEILTIVLDSINDRMEQHEELVLILEGMLAIPILMILEEIQDHQPELLQRVESIKLVSPITPTTLKVFLKQHLGWGRKFLPKGFIFLSIANWLVTNPITKGKVLSHLEHVGKDNLIDFFHSLKNYMKETGPKESKNVPISRRLPSMTIILAQSCPMLSEHRRDMVTFFSNQTVAFLRGHHGFLDHSSRLIDQLIPTCHSLASEPVVLPNY